MAFSFLPSLNAAIRQSHPKLQRIRSLVQSPGRGVAVGIGNTPHNANGLASGQQMAIRPVGAKMMAYGGRYADGDLVDDQGNFNIDSVISPQQTPDTNTPYADPSGYGPANAPTVDPSYPDPMANSQYMAPSGGPSPGTIGNQPSLIAAGHTQDYNDMMNSGPDMGTATHNPDGSITFVAPQSGGSTSENPQQQGGLAGWLQSKHGGIPGANWLKGGLALTAGILSGLGAKHANQRQIKPFGLYAQGGMVGSQGLASPAMALPQQIPVGSVNPMHGLASGGYVQGPGDGMSDSVPMNNGNAALSNGEFVFDADSVSQIGNGSNAAGAAKLNAARQRLRMLKHGTPHQPPRVPDSQNPILRAIK